MPRMPYTADDLRLHERFGIWCVRARYRNEDAAAHFGVSPGRIVAWKRGKGRVPLCPIQNLTTQECVMIARWRLGWTQQILAERIGVTTASVLRMERFERHDEQGRMARDAAAAFFWKSGWPL